MSERITRRQLAGAAVASAVVSVSVASVSVAQVPVTGQDFDRAARESHRENSEVLAKFEIPMSVEPAFQFKA
jgi:hypothetical protein